MEFSDPLLLKYRSDRRKLLQFLLSPSFIKEIKSPAGKSTSVSNIDFDSLSADYVLECVQSGGILDVSQATKRYYDESSYPVMRRLQLGDAFYLHSDLHSAGSPPRRTPPPIIEQQQEYVESHSSQWSNHTAGERSDISSWENRINCKATVASDESSLHHTSSFSLGLPTLHTGLMKV